MNEGRTTSHTLLECALDLNDEKAWQVLTGHYANFIRFILRKFDVREGDVDDIVQQVLIQLTSKLKQYDREQGKFRTWLGSLIRTTALMHFRKTNAFNKKLDKFSSECAVFDPEASPADIDAVISDEWAAYVTNVALENLSKTYSQSSMEVLKLDLEGYKAPEIAEKTGLKLASVYSIKSRVKKDAVMELKSTIRQLEM